MLCMLRMVGELARNLLCVLGMVVELAQSVLGMMVAGLPVVVNVDSEEGGPQGSEPELPPEKKSRSSSSNNPEPSGPNDESREEG